ncbi:hypothetical protein PM082_020366 [Marasmius tenuissimus]|nr:hypothetical protein PM082_020366 [Marasmius tenuissimus]
MVVVLPRLSGRITVVEPDSPLALLVVDAHDSYALFTSGDRNGDHLTDSGGCRLAPATLSADLDTEKVDLSFIGVFPGVSPGDFASNVGSDVGCTWVVAVGDWGTELEPPTAVGEVTLFQKILISAGSGRMVRETYLFLEGASVGVANRTTRAVVQTSGIRSVNVLSGLEVNLGRSSRNGGNCHSESDERGATHDG